MLISQILRRKGDDVATIAPGSSISEAISALARYGVGALVVSTDAENLEGIISERDIVRSFAVDGARALKLTVADLMTAEVFTCEIDATTGQLMAEMTERRIRHVPVVTDGVLGGIVSIGDVVDARVRQLEEERQQLTDYISGR